MFDVTKIKEAYRGLVGFIQNPDPSGVMVKDSQLLTSISSLFVSTQHPLLTIENLASIAPSFERFEYSPFAAGNYLAGAIVAHNGKKWRSATSTAQIPGTGDDWKEYDGFTSWLQDRYDENVVAALTEWLNQKSGMRTSANLLQRNWLYQMDNRSPGRSPNVGKQVGLQLRLPKSTSLVAKLLRVSCQFEQAQTFTLSLYRSDRPSVAIETQQIVYDTPGDTKWFTLDWTLPAGPYWYVTYDQDEITGEAYNHFTDLSGRTMSNYPAGRWLGVHGFEDGPVTGDPVTLITQSHDNHGLNLEATVACDYTELMVDQKLQFADLVAKKMARYLLHELAMNPGSNVNRNQTNVSPQTLLYELNGEAAGRPSGIVYEYHKALKAVAFDKSNIDKICLPCKSTGARIKSI